MKKRLRKKCQKLYECAHYLHLDDDDYEIDERGEEVRCYGKFSCNKFGYVGGPMCREDCETCKSYKPNFNNRHLTKRQLKESEKELEESARNKHLLAASCSLRPRRRRQITNCEK